MLKPAEMFQRTPPTKKRVMLPSCRFAMHLQSQWKPGAWHPVLARVQDTTSQLSSRTCCEGQQPAEILSASLASALEEENTDQKVVVPADKTCQLDHLYSSDCAHITFSLVLLLLGARSCLPLLLNLAVSPFSFVLSWGLCASSVPNEQRQDFNWSSFCWRDDPFAQENSPAKPDEISLFSFSFSFHVLLLNEGMTLIKIYTLTIKIGMCLSPTACYCSKMYSSSMTRFKAGWISQGSFINLNGFGIESDAACGNDGVQNSQEVMLRVSCPLFPNQLDLSACVLLDDHSFSCQILLPLTSAWSRPGKTNSWQPSFLLYLPSDMDIPEHHTSNVWEKTSSNQAPSGCQQCYKLVIKW